MMDMFLNDMGNDVHPDQQKKANQFTRELYKVLKIYICYTFCLKKNLIHV